MASSNNDEIVSHASLHTQKKFELIENYVMPWAQKLMNNPSCNGLIFIDCMCNSGIYYGNNREEILGTPIRVAKILRDIAGQYPNKAVYLYFNDYNSEKTDLLKTKLPTNKRNYHNVVTSMDGNALLKAIGSKLTPEKKMHFLLFYDPYDASIDWEALLPFFRNWGEIIINHMVSDPVRSIKQVKKTVKKEKYESTYLIEFENLVPYGSDKNAYEKRIEKIINTMKGHREYYVAAFPFYNTQNSQVYSLIHCTSNKEGFKLYKKCAWKSFGDKSSTKTSKINSEQLVFDEHGQITTVTDESCFTVQDITKYLQKAFSGREHVRLDEMWSLLDNHPIFPSDGYREDIKRELIEIYGATKETIANASTGKRETLFTFSTRLHS